MPSVMQRLGHSITKAGEIRYRERPVTWERAEAVAGRRLDRRKNYMIIRGQVCSSVSWTAACSGCNNEIGGGRGFGCHECGYHGLRRQSYWMPDDGSMPK